MRRVLLLILAILVGGIGNQAIAVDFENGLYVGTNFGAADNLTVCDDLQRFYQGPADPNSNPDILIALPNPASDTRRRNLNLSSPSDCKDNDFGLQLFAGWQFVKWLAIEGGWTDLDTTTYTAPDGTSTKGETSGWQLNAVGTLPYLERIGLFFKAGVFAWDLDVKETLLDGSTSRLSEDGTDFVYGLALRYPLTDTIGISLEIQRFEDIGNSKTRSYAENGFDVNLWSAGFIFRL